MNKIGVLLFLAVGLSGCTSDKEDSGNYEDIGNYDDEIVPLPACDVENLQVNTSTSPISFSWSGNASDISIEPGANYDINTDEGDNSTWAIQCDDDYVTYWQDEYAPANCLTSSVSYGEVPSNGFEFDSAKNLTSGESYTFFVGQWCDTGTDWDYYHQTKVFVAP